MTGPAAGRRVLVIEDDVDVLGLLLSHLRGLGCPTQGAATGEDGLALARADPPDVVIVDVQLPGIDGRQVVASLRDDERTRGCRIVLSSVLDSQDLQGLATDAVLPKPFSRHDVARVLGAVVALPDRPASEVG